jgi:hypothetical protein
MTLQTELAVSHKTPATVNNVPRGGSYVTLPADREIQPRVEGSYVSLPGVLSGAGNKAQGTYVTLHSAPAGKTEVSYTRVG